MRARAVTIVALALMALLAACSSGSTTSASGSLIVGRSSGAGLAGVGDLPEPASAWPASGYDARHSSATSERGPQTGHVRWHRALEGDATPGPVIGSDGSVLVATHAGVLHALDPSTGADRWTYDGGGGYGSDLSTSPAVAAGGTILWPGPRNTLFALSAEGTPLWTETFGATVLSPAVAGRNRVYVADLAGRLTALEVTGAGHRRAWTLEVGGPDYASPTVGPDGTIYTASDNNLVAVRDLGSKGVERFRFRSTRLVEVSNAVAADGTVVLGTNGDRQYGVATDGSVRWAVDIGDYTYSSSVVRPEGTAYFGDNMGRLRVLDTRTGAVERTFVPLGAGQEKIWTQPVADAVGSVYWATTAGNVYGYDRAGRQLFRLAVGSGVDSYPCLGGDGTLYIGSTSGEIYAIGS